MRSVSVVLLSFVLLGVMCCEGCWKEEREALLSLKSRFDFSIYSTGDIWWDATVDCCEWARVECNSSTGRVAKLNLHDVWSNENFLNYSDFLVFKDLKSLIMSGNGIVGCADNEGLGNLEVLDLSSNDLNNAASILSCLDGLSSLKSSYLAANSFNASSFHEVFETLSSKLHNLEVLDISYNYLTNDIVPSLCGFTSLKDLYLAENQLDSDLHFQPGLCSTLMNLEVLDMSFNNFNDSDIAFALSGLSSLKSLNLRSCELTPRSIFNVSKLSSLEILDLAGNNLNESILWRIGNDGFTWPPNLQVLGLHSNSFSNKFLSSLSGLGHLKSLDLSENRLEGSLHIDFCGVSNLEHLVLDGNYNLGNEFLKRIGELTSLKVLSLLGCGINGTLPAADWSKLKKLEELDLSYNEFEGQLPSSFVNMTSLWMLELSQNHFVGKFGSNLASLTSLKHFGFIGNQFEVPISFTPFANHSNLKFIYGEGNKVILDSQPSFQTWIPKFQLQVLSLSSMTQTNSLPLPNFLLYQNSLTSLDFTSCKLEREFPHWLLENNTKMTELLVRNCSFSGTFQLPSHPLPNIRRIDVSDNILIGQIPSKNISSFYPNLQFLYLSRNHIQGSIPYELGQMNLLDTLDLSENQLSGKIPEHIFGARHQLKFSKHSKNNLEGPILTMPNHLEYLLLNDNNFIGRLPISIFNTSIISLDISHNHLEGKIPSMFGKMNLLDTLDLSNNHLSGEIPHELSNMSSLRTLDLSNNQLSGEIPEGIFGSRSQSPIGFGVLKDFGQKSLLLNDNKLIGRPPRSIFNTSITSLDISNNHLVGTISSLVNTMSPLKELSMSNNHFEGSIPLELAEYETLIYLDLSQNNLTGHVPSFISSSLRIIHLNNNHLSGLSKKVSNGNSSLVMLDLSYNAITNIQDLSYTGLNILLLKGNHITGDIPMQLCKFRDLSILDLSHNNFSGAIPNCLGKMPFENKDSKQLLNLFHGIIGLRGMQEIHIPNVQEKANFTSKKRTDTYMGSILAYMSGIDLSHNNLKGNIPSELGNLTRIRALNLSYNDLTGQIPCSFSNLVQSESLDLSFNMLSGQIPSQLSRLTSLEVFSVAYNNLSGATPEWTGQFSTFDESSYEGNSFLCGPPLPKSCNPPPTIIPNKSYTHGDNGSLVDMYVFYVSFAVSYTTALLATATALYINPYWRRTWFYYMEFVSSNCYYFIVDNLCRFSNSRNM